MHLADLWKWWNKTLFTVSFSVPIDLIIGLVFLAAGGLFARRLVRWRRANSDVWLIDVPPEVVMPPLILVGVGLMFTYYGVV